MKKTTLENISLVSASETVSNTNAAIDFGVRFFAYSVFYYFFEKKSKGCG